MRLTFETLLFVAPAFIVAIAVHEASHALAATVLGDTTPRRQGRLTLNPLRHLDPLGTVTLFLMGFGWGKPVFVNPGGFRISPRIGMALVAFAGPLSNIALAVLFALPFRLGYLPFAEVLAATNVGSVNLLDATESLLFVMFSINLLLAVFNMIPLPPLDGFSVLLGILPRPMALTIAPLAQYGPAALLGLFALSYVFKLNVLGTIMDPPQRVLAMLIMGG